MSDAQEWMAQQFAGLRAPFAAQEIGHLPKMWCRDCSQSSTKTCQRHPNKNRCDECGGFHSAGTLHLDYVGHAEVTDRLLAVDPLWSWEPMALGANGLPQLDANGGMWIRLTVCGATKLGYGDAPGKTGGNAVKETIGDALRNAAMRFGVGLDLWRKSERAEAEASKDAPEDIAPVGVIGHGDFRVTVADWTAQVAKADGMAHDQAEHHLRALWEKAKESAELRAIVTAGINRFKARPPVALADPVEGAPLAAMKGNEHAAAPQPTEAEDAERVTGEFLTDLDQCTEARDGAGVRALMKKAADLGRPDLRKIAQAALDDLRGQGGKR